MEQNPRPDPLSHCRRRLNGQPEDKRTSGSPAAVAARGRVEAKQVGIGIDTTTGVVAGGEHDEALETKRKRDTYSACNKYSYYSRVENILCEDSRNG